MRNTMDQVAQSNCMLKRKTCILPIKRSSNDNLPRLRQPLVSRSSKTHEGSEEKLRVATPLKRDPHMKSSLEGTSNRVNPLLRQNSLSSTKNLDDSTCSSSGQTLSGKLAITKVIGVGKFSEVYEVVHKSNNMRFALKKSLSQFKSKNDRARYMQEFKISKALGICLNLVKYFAAWQENRFYFLQMELCKLGSLRSLMDYRDLRYLSIAVKCGKDIAAGLEHLHGLGFVHLDIKPDNILINTEGVLKVGDLGFSCKSGSLSSADGDIRYVAPEALQERPCHSSLDMFSLGLLLLNLSTYNDGLHMLPTGGEAWHTLRKGRLPLDLEKCFPTKLCLLKPIIFALTDSSPFKRPSASKIYALFSKMVFDEHLWSKLCKERTSETEGFLGRISFPS